MAYKFNPFTGTLDEVGAGGGGGTPGGVDTQVQFNDGGAFGGDAGLTYNKTTDELTLAGDLSLDSGGSFATTIQSVTPTANRTISFPDQTGTVGLVSGATGNIQYNNAGQLAGTGDLNTELDWVSPTGTYTALKVNADSNSGNTGTLLDLQVDGTSQLRTTSTGRLEFNTSVDYLLWIQNYATGIRNANSGTLAFRVAGAEQLAVNVNQVRAVNFGLTSSVNSSNDVVFARDAADTLAQRRGTAAQTYRLYNTYTDANNYQRTSITDDSTGLIIDQQYATDGGGPGAARTNLLDLKDNGTSKITFRENELAFDAGTTTIYAGTTGAGSNVRVGGRGTIGTIPLEVAYSNITIANRATLGFTTGPDINTGIDIGLKRDSAKVIAVTNGTTGTGYLKQTPVLTSDLPSAATVGAGTRGFVSDAGSTTFNVDIGAGTGTPAAATTIPVFSDGSVWKAG